MSLGLGTGVRGSRLSPISNAVAAASVYGRLRHSPAPRAAGPILGGPVRLASGTHGFPCVGGCRPPLAHTGMSPSLPAMWGSQGRSPRVVVEPGLEDPLDESTDAPPGVCSDLISPEALRISAHQGARWRQQSTEAGFRAMTRTRRASRVSGVSAKPEYQASATRPTARSIRSSSVAV
jgi:hypothetical protein